MGCIVSHHPGGVSVQLSQHNRKAGACWAEPDLPARPSRENPVWQQGAQHTAAGYVDVTVVLPRRGPGERTSQPLTGGFAQPRGCLAAHTPQCPVALRTEQSRPAEAQEP